MPDRLQVLDYMTLSWNPTEFEQWLGRIVRQGNQNPEVAAHVWSTEGTIEVLRADKIAMKSAPFEALLDGTSETRRVNEETYDPLSAWAADMATRMSGNPLLNQQREAQLEVDTAQGMQDEWQRENGVKARRVATMNTEIQELEDEERRHRPRPGPRRRHPGRQVRGAGRDRAVHGARRGRRRTDRRAGRHRRRRRRQRRWPAATRSTSGNSPGSRSPPGTSGSSPSRPQRPKTGKTTAGPEPPPGRPSGPGSSWASKASRTARST